MTIKHKNFSDMSYDYDIILSHNRKTCCIQHGELM
jgi:hypothetical protein